MAGHDTMAERIGIWYNLSHTYEGNLGISRDGKSYLAANTANSIAGLKIIDLGSH